MNILISNNVLYLNGAPFCCAIGGDVGEYGVGISMINGRMRPVLSNASVVTTAIDVTCHHDIALGQTIINGSTVNGSAVVDVLTQEILRAINHGEVVMLTVAE